MHGQFIFSTCNAAGLRLKAMVRNTLRIGEEIPIALREDGMQVDLHIFHAGQAVFQKQAFARIPLNGYAEISEKTCPVLADTSRDYTIIARCSLNDGSPRYFAQEHQLIYEDLGTGHIASLLYDQMPLQQPGRKTSPILLLAPKIWVGGNLNTFVLFANASGNTETENAPLQMEILDGEGHRLHRFTLQDPHNATRIVNIREMLAEQDLLPARPTLFNLVARGGASSYVILTFIRNDVTGSIGLEHSLSPHYYLNGDFARVRQEAFVFPSIAG